MKINNNVLDVLSNATITENRVVLNGQLDRSLYMQVNKVLEAAGAKWSRKDKAHLFNGDTQTIIENVILTGEITVHQDFDYFPTPDNIIDAMIDRASLSEGMRFLEPSAGKGAIAKRLGPFGQVDCIELYKENAECLRSLGFSVQELDFLSLGPNPIYDRILMNPPFGKQNDIKHVTHALSFLKKGGLLVSVMSASVLFRTNKLTAEFRSLINERGGRMDSLPEKSFKESGTSVNTILVSCPG